MLPRTSVALATALAALTFSGTASAQSFGIYVGPPVVSDYDDSYAYGSPYAPTAPNILVGTLTEDRNDTFRARSESSAIAPLRMPPQCALPKVGRWLWVHKRPTRIAMPTLDSNRGAGSSEWKASYKVPNRANGLNPLAAFSCAPEFIAAHPEAKG
jgi:hypothetical protein